MRKQIKMLSLWQPWASLCIWKNPDGKAEKQIETRHWDTLYRGLVAIHATKSLNLESRTEIQTNKEIQSALIRHGWHKKYGDVHKGELTVGSILGVVTLTNIVQFECSHPDILSEYPDREKHFGLYHFGRFGWIFTDPIEFKNPIDCRGLQSLGTPKPEIKEQIFERLEAIDNVD